MLKLITTAVEIIFVTCVGYIIVDFFTCMWH
jgi:hypothetical protein